MTYVGALLGSLAVFGLFVEWILRKVAKPRRKFPYCWECGLTMPTAVLPKFMPGEVLSYLDKYGLPTAAASRFICPKGHYQLWFVPKFGNTEKAFFLKGEL